MKNQVLSLEDISRGIHFAMSTNQRAEDARLFVGEESEIIQILTSDDPDHSTFAAEAFHEYEASERFAAFANSAMESISHDIKILADVKKKYGIEAMNPYIFGFEDDPIRKKGVLARVWGAIAEAFRRIIRAIANLIRSILNWIGGKMMSGQIKWYSAHKTEIEKAMLDTSKMERTFKARISTAKWWTIPASTNGFVKDIKDATSGMQKHLDKIISEVEKINSGKGTIFTSGALLIDAKMEKMAEDKLRNAYDGLGGNPSKLSDKDLKNVGVVINNIFYGANMPVSVSIVSVKRYFKDTGIKSHISEIFDQKFLTGMKEFVKAGKTAMADTQKAMNNMEKARASCEKAVTKSAAGNKGGANKSTQSNINKCLSAIMKVSTQSREYYGIQVSILLNIFREVLGQMGYASRAMHTLVAGSKKDDGKKDNKK